MALTRLSKVQINTEYATNTAWPAMQLELISKCPTLLLDLSTLFSVEIRQSLQRLPMCVLFCYVPSTSSLQKILVAFTLANAKDYQMQSHCSLRNHRGQDRFYLWEAGIKRRKLIVLSAEGTLWQSGQGVGLAVAWLSVQTLFPRACGCARLWC